MISTQESLLKDDTSIDEHNMSLASAMINYSLQSDLHDINRSLSKPSGTIPEETVSHKILTQPTIALGKTGILSTGITICNANIGAGILVLAFGVSEAGWVMGAIFFFVFAIMSSFAFNLLMSVARVYNEYNEKASFAIVCKDTIPFLQKYLDIFIIFGYYLVNTSYLIAVGSYMPLVFNQFYSNDNTDVSTRKYTKYTSNRVFWIIIFVIFLITPTTMLKDLKALKYVSFFAILCYSTLTIVIIYKYFALYNTSNNDIEIDAAPESVFDFFRAAPLFIFAYGGHPLAFGLTNELKNSTLKRITVSISWSFTFISILYCVIGLFGYFSFGNGIDANILVNYNDSDTLIIVVRILLTFGLVFSYPVIGNAWKDAAASLIFKTYRKKEDAKNLPNRKYYILCFILIFSTTVTACLVDDLGKVTKLQGATAGTFLQIIVPGLFYYFSYKLPPKKYQLIKENSFYKVKMYGAVFLIIFGSIMIPFGVVLIWL